jgi:chromosome partitioning protein
VIIVVGGIKGGCGKTTIATNLAALRASQNKKVLFVDADEQESAYNWVLQREVVNAPVSWTTIKLTGKTIHSQLKLMGPDYDDIIIDVGEIGRAHV